MYKINKLQEYIVQHREYSLYFIITINGKIYLVTLKIVNHCYTPETYNIVHQLYLNS